MKALGALVATSAALFCPLETLKFSGGPANRLKAEIIPFINALNANETLQELDITAHQTGDDLAAALARMLQTNKGLRTLHIGMLLISPL